MHLVKLCVLGSAGVGKTSLIEQLVNNDFVGQNRPSQPSGDNYNFSILINKPGEDNLFQVKIIDMPMINYFPSNTFSEWNDFRGCALRNANAYLFVFDLTCPNTFHYIKVIRDQLFESRNMQNIPVWVVGNKVDLCMNVLATMRGHRDHHHHLQSHSHVPYENMTPAFKELSNLIKKHWKCSYLECSAKYNWRVLPIFRDIMKSLENSLISHDSSNHQHHLHHHQFHREHGDHHQSDQSMVTVVGGPSSGAFRNLQNSTSNDNATDRCVIT